MTRFVAVWSLQRGVIDPPEPLDESSQRMADKRLRDESCGLVDERDKPMTAEQEWLEELGRRTVPKQTRA